MVIKNRYPFKKSRRWHLVRLCDFVLDWFGPYHSSKPFPQDVKNILVIRLDHMGDLICTLPALPVLKERFPAAKITVLTGIEGQAILKENPFVDNLIIFRSNWFSRRNSFNPVELFSVLAKLRKIKFDVGYDFRGDLRNILLMVLAGVPFRIGYGIAGGAGLLNEVGEYDEALHQVELNMKLLTGEVPDRQSLKLQIYLSSYEREEAQQILDQAGVQKTDKIIAIHPEAGYPSKEWAEENVRSLILRLTEDPQNKIILLGLSKAERIVHYFNSNPQVFDFVGKFSLRQMIAIINQCNAFLGNDSGPSHIAQALGIPVLVIASGTNEYEKWGVWRQPSKILSHTVPCAPCHLQVCTVEGHPCMVKISSEQAFEAMKQLFSEVA